MPRIVAEALEQTGLSDDEFQACLTKWQADPRLLEHLLSSQRQISALMHDAAETE